MLTRLDLHLHLEPVLYYVIEACGDQDNAIEFLEAIANALPQSGEVIMTYGQQLRQQGKQEGMQQGMQQGIQQRSLEIAKNLLREGLDEKLVTKATGLDEKMVIDLKRLMS